MALDGHSVRGLGWPARAPPVILVAARYMFDGPSVIAGRLPALLPFLNRHGGQAGSGSATARR